jgi:hypothetical protein
MPSYSTQTAPAPERSLPAWGFSVVGHLSVIVLLAIVIRPWPQGAAEHGNGSIGIVLNESSADGRLRDGDEGRGDNAPGLEQVLEPPALITPPTQPTTMAELGRDPAQMVPVKLAATPVAQQNNAPANSRPTAGGGVGRSGSPGGTGYAKVSVFGVEGKGSKFVYLFDRSASMEGPPLTAAKKQLLESLRSLDSLHQFQVVFFNSTTRVFDAAGGAGGGKRIAFATDRNKQLAANFIGGITADGGTDRMVALREAIAMTPNVIFFLSDADDPMTSSEMAEITRLNRRAQAAICVIEFGRKPTPMPDNFLMQLARESGGQYGYIDTTTLSQPVGQR